MGDFSDAGIPRNALQRLTSEGGLVQVGRGRVEAAGRQASAESRLAEGAFSSPKATIARLSALRVHALTTQSPHEVWVLLGTKDWAPGAAPSRLRRVRASGEALTAGVDRRLSDGIEAAIIDPAKTIADGFKYRSKVGLDLAIEALRNGLKRRIVKRPRLSDSARIWRVQSVMKPSVEAMV